MRNRFLSFRGTCWLHLKNILSISSFTKKTLTFSFNTAFSKAVTSGKEEVQHHWKNEASMSKSFEQNVLQSVRLCPFENDNCSMAHVLSKQEDFTNQVFMLETVIQQAGHECTIFLPKFHRELMINPIVPNRFVFMKFTDLFSIYYSIGGGLSIGIVKSARTQRS
jgi:hypothetical protein